MTLFSVLAFSAGAAIAIQASLNAHLGTLLKSALWATGIAFFVSCFFTFATIFIFTKQSLQLQEIKQVPLYLWFSGGALSAFAVAAFYFLIPQMGIGSMMSFALSGQMMLAMLAGHFGWFDLPVKPVDAQKLIGVVAMIIGMVFINWEAEYGHG